MLAPAIETIPTVFHEMSSSSVAERRKTWSVIETALPRLFELRSFSLVGIALVPPKG